MKRRLHCDAAVFNALGISRLEKGLPEGLLYLICKNLTQILTGVKKVTVYLIETKESCNLIELFNIGAPIIKFMRKLDTNILCSANSGSVIEPPIIWGTCVV